MLLLRVPLLRRIRETERNFAHWVRAFVLGLDCIAARRRFPRILLFFGFAPGDDLLCTGVLHELRNRGSDALFMVSNNRELFIGNDDVAHVFPLVAPLHKPFATRSLYEKFVKLWGGEFIWLSYGSWREDQTEPPSRHIIGEMCAKARIAGSISLRPYLTLTEDEEYSAVWAKGRIIIQSSGMAGTSPMRNKQWFVDRFQSVVDALCEEYEFIQLGSATDPMLDHAEDLRGRTSIRESASILHHARLYVGTVGFLMHLARAVECPAVIVYGGREAPWQSGYISNFNLYSAVPCAPCWRLNSCDFDRKCMGDISVSDVVSAIRQMLNSARGPLTLQTIDLMPEVPKVQIG
jgi:hypothetical protein